MNRIPTIKGSLSELASHAGVNGGARFSSLPKKRAPLKAAAWEAICENAWKAKLKKKKAYHTSSADPLHCTVVRAMINDYTNGGQFY